MIKIILLLALVPTFTLASTKLKDETQPVDSYCAKMNLSAIYGAEKSYYSEYATYADNFKDIGFEQTDPSCNDWQLDIRLNGNGQAFLANAKHPDGQEWSINETKQLVNEHGPN
ncbi:MAG: hypothetical protein ACXWQO_15505 [Bdellovibrionota bacterium]